MMNVMKSMMAGAVMLTATVVNADLLWDIEAYRGGGAAPPFGANYVMPTLADFTDAGVSEDISGETVQRVTHANGAPSISDGTVTLTPSGGYSSYSALPTQNPILNNYLFINNAVGITNQLSGLSAVLAPETNYSFYLWGIGDSPGQESTFTFDGTTITTSDANPDTTPAIDYMAKFSFSTGVTVSDTLDFLWQTSGNGGFNGLAIVEAIPEPATFGLFAAFGGAVLFVRRRFML